MTETTMPLFGLLEKGAEDNFLRVLAEQVLQLMMEADVEGQIGAGRHERSFERRTWRNGYRERTPETRLGSLSVNTHGACGWGCGVVD